MLRRFGEPEEVGNTVAFLLGIDDDDDDDGDDDYKLQL